MEKVGSGDEHVGLGISSPQLQGHWRGYLSGLFLAQAFTCTWKPHSSYFLIRWPNCIHHDILLTLRLQKGWLYWHTNRLNGKTQWMWRSQLTVQIPRSRVPKVQFHDVQWEDLFKADEDAWKQKYSFSFRHRSASLELRVLERETTMKSEPEWCFVCRYIYMSIRCLECLESHAVWWNERKL